MKCSFSILAFILLMTTAAFAQSDSAVVVSQKATDTLTTNTKMEKVHNPKVAIALSAVIPGAGQIYNRKWWKVPIVYACLGTASYFIYDFSTQTKRYKMEYRYRTTGELDKLDPKLSMNSDDNILAERNFYRRYMEISIAALAIVYMLNIIDAAVDAHLYYFDISDNLALSVQPFIQYNPGPITSVYRGVSLRLNF